MRNILPRRSQQRDVVFIAVNWREQAEQVVEKVFRSECRIGMGKRDSWKIVALWADLYWRAHGHEVPYLVDLVVSDGYAAEGPVDGAVGGTDPAAAIGQAVNHDIAAGRDAKRDGPLAIVGIGIGNVQRLVIRRMGLAAVDDVMAFGRAAVAPAFLARESGGAERDLVRVNDLPVGEQFEQMIAFQDQDGIDLFMDSVSAGRGARREAEKGRDQRCKQHRDKNAPADDVGHAPL